MSVWINVSHMAVHTRDLHENLKQMYRYCNVVEPQVVGSDVLNLLRVVSREGEKVREQTRWEPIRAEYLKLSKNISIQSTYTIIPPLGTVMPFLNGTSIINLHFRKVYLRR